ncbi:MAG: IPTL-CTERM sorting domain-containing protein, partial [bacterium]|nr:IPTL-CTERM sorting domain-containing protein [bacterium]
HGYELWRSDGTAEGTGLLLDIWPGPENSDPGRFTEFGGELYFSAGDPIHGRELWRSDGTAAGTRLFTEVHPGVLDSHPYALTVSSGRLFFGSYHNSAYGELWGSDGTPEGTELVRSFYGNPKELTDLGGTLYFGVSYLFDFAELWRSDGSAQGTSRFWEFEPLMYLHSVQGAGDLLFVHLSDLGRNVGALWRSDGTAEGTFWLSDTIKYLDPFPWGDRILFQIQADPTRRELWVSEGTPEGTFFLRDFLANPAQVGPKDFLVVAGEVWFTADDGVHGLELWKTDGTPEGTVLAADLFPGPGSLEPSHLTLVGDRLFFAGDDGVHGRELWTIGVLVSAISIPTLDAWGLVALALVLVALGILLLRRWRSTSYSECQATRDSTSPHHAT